ncbi:glycosyl transferase family 1 [Candidatus Falkowbacteria bacterium CG10_big_fil_rev_8_21_14_0_10_37_6]|uniref:Glycosyl transferase family 1 n=1 Tax=Candidatus Falkowbacteria bacterium CG10_big_fil_rev_8_21_14_0_10_37_6 TaxID=1974563 RepID=A0A2H0V739_9BACT|nr:MAG: glycosyl transferase family 1 [Candidatus Falkowbacteria bacterium CG10_big_fil_rev_8_21_14_0_10_37_6]
MNKKILIIHDRFQYRGGGERLCLIMANGLKADILTEYWDEENSFVKSEALGKIFMLGKKFNIRGLGYVSAQLRFFFKTDFIKNYDIIIFSGNNCLSAAWRARGKRKIMYCHTPVRYAYDLKNYYFKSYPFYLKPVFLFFAYLARFIYQWGIKKMDKIMANSKNVQNRLKYYCHMESAVVYPPIDTEKFKWLGQNDYYLSFARLVDLKRVADIARAFQKMPDKKLIIASGGPEFASIKKLAANFNNIKVLGFVSDEKLAELVGNCIANIYIPRQEDFGMSPLEAASAGKPTIGVDDGGLRETVLHGKTGYLMSKNYKIEDLIVAVKWLDYNKAERMKKYCEKQAEKFSKSVFLEGVKLMLQ